jgi:hypothetical protein
LEQSLTNGGKLTGSPSKIARLKFKDSKFWRKNVKKLYKKLEALRRNVMKKHNENNDFYQLKTIQSKIYDK